MLVPVVGYGGLSLLNHHNVPHVLKAGIGWDEAMERRLVLERGACPCDVEAEKQQKVGSKCTMKIITEDNSEYSNN